MMAATTYGTTKAPKALPQVTACRVEMGPLQNDKRTATPPSNKTKTEQGWNDGRGGGDKKEVRQTKKAQEM
jgi:hypothetical protein